MRNFYKTKMELVEKLNYYNPENCEENNLFNLKKAGTDILEYKKKQLEKESEQKEKIFAGNRKSRL